MAYLVAVPPVVVSEALVAFPEVLPVVHQFHQNQLRRNPCRPIRAHRRWTEFLPEDRFPEVPVKEVAHSAALDRRYWADQ